MKKFRIIFLVKYLVKYIIFLYIVMLTNSEKFVLDKVLYDMLSNFWSINGIQIETKKQQLVSQIVFKKIWTKVNAY